MVIPPFSPLKTQCGPFQTGTGRTVPFSPKGYKFQLLLLFFNEIFFTD